MATTHAMAHKTPDRLQCGAKNLYYGCAFLARFRRHEANTSPAPAVSISAHAPGSGVTYLLVHSSRKPAQEPAVLFNRKASV
jgi:hypothetical protein